MSTARYHSISLQLDPMGPADTYKLQFSTMPGMSTSITDLHMGDLDALLARILSGRNEAASGETITKSREDVTDTNVLNEALSTYLDQHENGEDPE